MGATSQVTQPETEKIASTAGGLISGDAVERTGKASTPKRHNAARLFGYDVFISFALGETEKSNQQIELGKPPRSTRSYASDLARRLRERDFTVFFSEDVAAPGEELDSTLVTALYRSRVLVVIANRGTLRDPNWVRKEVEEFRSRHPDRPIIPISVDGAVEDAELKEQTQQWLKFGDKIWLDETDDAVAHGIASKELVERLALAPAGRKSNVKWRWVVRAVVAGLIGLAGAATWFGINAKHQQGIAEENAHESQARELTVLSKDRLSDDPERSVLLAMHAVNATVGHGQPPVPTAEDVLHQALMASQVRLTLRGHFGPVDSVAWSPDGMRLATASKVWEAASGKELLTLLGHTKGVTSVVWSPDGKRLAAAGYEGGLHVEKQRLVKQTYVVKVWEAASGQELLTLKGHDAVVNSVAWSPDGKRLATASDDGTAKVWDADSGTEQLTLHGDNENVVDSVAWSPDGKRLATSEGDDAGKQSGVVKVWDAGGGKELLTLRGHNSGVFSVAWSPDSKRLATGGYLTAKVWDAVSGKEVMELRGHDYSVNSVAWSPDGKRLATASNDKTAKVWDPASGKELLTLRGHTGNVESVAWSPDGKRLATAGDDETVKVWDTASGQMLMTSSNHYVLLNVAWSPDGKRLATGGSEKDQEGREVGVVKVLEGTVQDLLTLRAPYEESVYGSVASAVFSVAWSPDSKRLVTANYASAKVWDAASGKDLLTVSSHGKMVHGAAWSPDGKRVATGYGDGTAKVWDAVSGKDLLSVSSQDGMVHGLAWSPDGKRLATGGFEKELKEVTCVLKVWDADSGKELLTLRGHNAEVRSVAWSPDGKRLATASLDGTAKVWDAASGQELLALSDRHGSAMSVAWSPDGKRLATASFDGTAKVWDAASGQELLTLRGHTGSANSVAWSPDGKRLATGSNDGAVKVWDAGNGQELLTLKGHTNQVNSVAWSPDGKQLASAGDDGIVQIYAMEIHDLLKVARSRVTRDLTPEECEQYFQSKTCPAMP